MEFQVALAGGGSEEQLEAIRGEAARLRALHPEVSVPAVRSLAERVARAELPAAGGIDDVAIGIGGSELHSVAVDLTALHFVVVGPYRSGRTTALETLALGLAGAATSAAMALLAPRATRLTRLGVWAAAARGAAECAAQAAALLQEMQSRDPGAAPLVVVIDDAGDLLDPSTQSCLELIVRLGRDCNVRVVAAAETGAARAIGVPWLRELRKDAHGLLLRPDLPGDGDLLGAALPRRVRGGCPQGRGFLVRAGRHTLVQVAG